VPFGEGKPSDDKTWKKKIVVCRKASLVEERNPLLIMTACDLVTYASKASQAHELKKLLHDFRLRDQCNWNFFCCRDNLHSYKCLVSLQPSLHRKYGYACLLQLPCKTLVSPCRLNISVCFIFQIETQTHYEAAYWWCFKWLFFLPRLLITKHIFGNITILRISDRIIMWVKGQWCFPHGDIQEHEDSQIINSFFFNHYQP